MQIDLAFQYGKPRIELGVLLRQSGVQVVLGHHTIRIENKRFCHKFSLHFCLTVGHAGFNQATGDLSVSNAMAATVDAPVNAAGHTFQQQPRYYEIKSDQSSSHVSDFRHK